MKKVSVVITSYNQKEYAIQAIESVIAQSTAAHEIIVADDHSSDGSVDMIKAYMSRYPGRIKGVLQPENVGIPRNRNAGLAQVTGDYVFILDGDDRFLKDNIKQMLAVTESAPDIKCVYSNLRFIDAEGRLIRIRDQEDQPAGDIFFEIAMCKFGILRNMIIDYRLLREVGFLDERFPRYDGYDLTLRLAKQGKIAYIKEPLAEYRVYPTSDSRGLVARDHLNDLTGIYKKMQPLLKDLSRSQRDQVDRRWKRLFLNFYMKEAAERGSKIKRDLLPLFALGKRYLRLADLFGFFKSYRRQLKRAAESRQV
jgi:glycosyltransferase involved in cell wall biosynthesis